VLTLRDVGRRWRGLIPLCLDLDVVSKHARCCREAQRPWPRDLIPTDLPTLIPLLSIYWIQHKREQCRRRFRRESREWQRQRERSDGSLRAKLSIPLI
jgi:hypothetical protein